MTQRARPFTTLGIMGAIVLYVKFVTLRDAALNEVETIHTIRP
jgi:hypothetical protein